MGKAPLFGVSFWSFGVGPELRTGLGREMEDYISSGRPTFSSDVWFCMSWATGQGCMHPVLHVLGQGAWW